MEFQQDSQKSFVNYYKKFTIVFFDSANLVLIGICGHNFVKNNKGEFLFDMILQTVIYSKEGLANDQFHICSMKEGYLVLHSAASRGGGSR